MVEKAKCPYNEVDWTDTLSTNILSEPLDIEELAS